LSPVPTGNTVTNAPAVVASAWSKRHIAREDVASFAGVLSARRHRREFRRFLHHGRLRLFDECLFLVILLKRRIQPDHIAIYGLDQRNLLLASTCTAA
jgi:hypothetical protein